jgi:hypothetical protein
MSLLQAAFSHNGFQPSKGFFRDVVEKSRSQVPLLLRIRLIDSAVGMRHPAASLARGQTASAVNTANLAAKVGGPQILLEDSAAMARFISMRALPLFSDPAARERSPTLPAWEGYNLKAATFISEHGDVAGRQVAHALTRRALPEQNARGFTEQGINRQRRLRYNRKFANSVS